MRKFREGCERKRSSSGSEGQSHFEMTHEGNREKHGEGGRRGEERIEEFVEVSDVNYANQSFFAFENKCERGHGEKRDMMERTENPSGILLN